MQSQYLTDLDTRSLGGPWKRIVNQPFSWYSARFNLTGCNPLRFVSDEASVPRIPVAYLLFGGGGSWPAWSHDMLYRWPFEDLGRIGADKIFHDLHIAYHDRMMAENIKSSRMIPRAWRKVKRGSMTGAVVLAGWAAYKNYPGCLDYREARRRKCSGNEYFCRPCNLYYHMWRECVRPGYHPTLWKEHMT